MSAANEVCGLKGCDERTYGKAACEQHLADYEAWQKSEDERALRELRGLPEVPVTPEQAAAVARVNEQLAGLEAPSASRTSPSEPGEALTEIEEARYYAETGRLPHDDPPPSSSGQTPIDAGGLGWAFTAPADPLPSSSDPLTTQDSQLATDRAVTVVAEALLATWRTHYGATWTPEEEAAICAAAVVEALRAHHLLAGTPTSNDGERLTVTAVLAHESGIEEGLRAAREAIERLTGEIANDDRKGAGRGRRLLHRALAAVDRLIETGGGADEQ